MFLSFGAGYVDVSLNVLFTGLLDIPCFASYKVSFRFCKYDIAPLLIFSKFPHFSCRPAFEAIALQNSVKVTIPSSKLFGYTCFRIVIWLPYLEYFAIILNYVSLRIAFALAFAILFSPFVFAQCSCGPLFLLRIVKNNTVIFNVGSYSWWLLHWTHI